MDNATQLPALALKLYVRAAFCQAANTKKENEHPNAAAAFVSIVSFLCHLSFFLSFAPFFVPRYIKCTFRYLSICLLSGWVWIIGVFTHMHTNRDLPVIFIFLLFLRHAGTRHDFSSLCVGPPTHTHFPYSVCMHKIVIFPLSLSLSLDTHPFSSLLSACSFWCVSPCMDAVIAFHSLFLLHIRSHSHSLSIPISLWSILLLHPTVPTHMPHMHIHLPLLPPHLSQTQNIEPFL